MKGAHVLRVKNWEVHTHLCTQLVSEWGVKERLDVSEGNLAKPVVILLFAFAIEHIHAC